MWKVVLHNDERTTLDFLAEVVVKLFSRRQSEAAPLLLKLYREHRVVAGVYPDRLTAMAKMDAVQELAKARGVPLRVTAEHATRSQAA